MENRRGMRKYKGHSAKVSAQSHHPYMRPSPDGSFSTNTRVSLFQSLLFLHR